MCRGAFTPSTRLVSIRRGRGWFLFDFEDRGERPRCSAQAAANKLKYPKGAAQVVGVKEYLEDLAKKQTFFRDAAGNSRVSDTGHKWAKVKFGEFTKEAYDEWRAKGGKKLPNQMY